MRQEGAGFRSYSKRRYGSSLVLRFFGHLYSLTVAHHGLLKLRQGCHRYLQSRPPDHQSDQCCLPQPEACHPVLGISSLAATSDCAQTGDERVRTVARPITMVGALCPVSFSDCWLPHGGRPFERLVSRQCLSLSPVEPGQHVVDTFSVGDGSAQNAATRRGRPGQRGFC